VTSMASMALRVLFEEGGRRAEDGGGHGHRGHLPWGTGMRQTSLLGQGRRRMCWEVPFVVVVVLCLQTGPRGGGGGPVAAQRAATSSHACR
jgi:hypothetical protein